MRFGLGDALTGIPALRGLRRRYPDSPLLLAGREPVSSWLRRLGLIDGVIPTSSFTDSPPGSSVGRHVPVNLHGRGPESHRLVMPANPDELIAFDCPEAGHRRRGTWRPDEYEVHRWCRLLTDAGADCTPTDLYLPSGSDAVPTNRGPVVVHPGAASGARRWPRDRWAEVVRTLTADGHDVVLTGSSDESALCAHIESDTPRCQDLSGRLSLDQLAELVSRARLLLCGDTGVAHLATGYATPSVLLFGPTPPAWWGPAVDPHIHTVLYHGGVPGDPHADHPYPALLRITVPEVLTAARTLLSR